MSRTSLTSATFISHPLGDDDIISLLSRGGKDMDKALSFLYYKSNFRDITRSIVLKNNGQESDVEDLFQESISNMTFNICKKKYQGGSSLSTYFHAICKNKWMSKLRALKSQKRLKDQISSSSTEAVALIAIKEVSPTNQLSPLEYVLQHLDGPCANLLSLWSLGHSMAEIAQTLGYKNSNVASQKKHRCLKKLAEYIDKNPNLKSALREML